MPLSNHFIAPASRRVYPAGASPAARQGTKDDPPLVRWGLTLTAVGVVVGLIVLPVVNVFYQALAHGLGTYWRAIALDVDTRSAILLTLTVAPIAVALNLVFGV